MRTSLTIMLMLAASVLLTACSGPAPSTSAPAKPIPADVITASLISVPDILAAPGTVQPRDRVVLSSQINGFVREVRVRAGDVVTAGQILVALDSRDADGQKEGAQAGIVEAQAALAEARRGAQVAQSMRAAAQANADLANGTHARYQKLFASQSVSPQELDEMRARRDSAAAELAAKDSLVAASEDRLRQVEARIAQATAQMKRADVYVGWSVIKAPAAGRIVERNVDPGSGIFPGTPLMVVESTARPQVLASLSTAQAGSLRPGLEVQVSVPDQPGKFVSGNIAEIIPLSTSGSHTVQCKIDLPAGFAPVSGSFVTVNIQVGTRQALLVPVQAIRENGQITGVLVADSAGKAHLRLIKAAPYDRERMEILAGVEPGERIVARLTDQMTDGISLEIRR